MTILEQNQRYVIPNYTRYPVCLVRGEGSYVWDAEGKKYLDLSGGIAVSSLGHGHPALVKAISEQAKNLIHVSNLFFNEWQPQLAKKITRGDPGQSFLLRAHKNASPHGAAQNKEQGIAWISPFDDDLTGLCMAQFSQLNHLRQLVVR